MSTSVEAITTALDLHRFVTSNDNFNAILNKKIESDTSKSDSKDSFCKTVLEDIEKAIRLESNHFKVITLMQAFHDEAIKLSKTESFETDGLKRARSVSITMYSLASKFVPPSKTQALLINFADDLKTAIKISKLEQVRIEKSALAEVEPGSFRFRM